MAAEKLLLRPMEVAVLLGIGRTQTYQMLRRGELPGVIRIGKLVRISREALEVWVRERAGLINDDDDDSGVE